MAWNDKEFYGKENIAARKSWHPKDGWLALSKEVLYDISLSPSDKIVFAVLLNYVRSKGRGRCNPSVKKLASETGISTRHVRRSLEMLRKQFYIRWERTKSSSIFRIFSAVEREELMRVNSIRVQERAKKTF